MARLTLTRAAHLSALRRLPADILTLVLGASLGAYTAALAAGVPDVGHLVALAGALSALAVVALTAPVVEETHQPVAKLEMLLGLLVLVLFILGSVGLWYGDLPPDHWTLRTK